MRSRKRARPADSSGADASSSLEMSLPSTDARASSPLAVEPIENENSNNHTVTAVTTREYMAIVLISLGDTLGDELRRTLAILAEGIPIWCRAIACIAFRFLTDGNFAVEPIRCE